MEIVKTAAELSELLSEKGGCVSGEIYRAHEKLVLEKDGVYCGNGATVIAESGVEIIGSNVSLCDCKIVSRLGVVSLGDDVTVQNCEITAETCGIVTHGKHFIAKSNKIITAGDGMGIDICKGSCNCLVALNEITSANVSVAISESFNCVVILNDLSSIRAEKNTNLYIIKNHLGGAVEIKRNKYLICDDNNASEVISSENEEINGNNVQDINARVEYGANEELLPHTNKERFVGMECRECINDISDDCMHSFGDYLCSKAAENEVVIVPPGKYSVNEGFKLTAKQSNTDIYAYGAYAEASYLGQIVMLEGAENVNIFGLTLGYRRAPSGQVHIVEKLDCNRATAIVSAGYEAGFGKSDLSVYSLSHVYVFRSDSYHPYQRVGYKYDITDNGDGRYTLTFNDDTEFEKIEIGDVLTCRMSGANQQTIMLNRAKNVHFKDLTIHGYGQATHCRNRSVENVSYTRFNATPRAPFIIDKDTYDAYKLLEKKYGVNFEVYIDGEGRYRGTRPRIGGTGTMEVQDALGGVSLTHCMLDTMYDDGTNQRGTSSRVAGIRKNEDGTYTVYYKGCLVQAYQAFNSNNSSKSEFSIYECAPIEKGDVVSAYAADGAVLFDNATALGDAELLLDSDEHLAHTDEDGDNICDICHKPMYSPEVYRPAQNACYDPESGKLTFQIERNGKTDLLHYTTYIRKVRLSIQDVNFSAIRNYDLLSNDYMSFTQVFIDNITKGCPGFTFDNVYFRNGGARGMLIKTRDVTVKNCTFKDMALQGMIIGRENVWGESSVPKNVTVKNCIFDNTAIEHQNKKNSEFAQITIQGVGERNNNITLNDNFACSNITLKHNKFLNTGNGYIINASGVKALDLLDNVFEERKGDGKILYLNGCIDVNISKNTYSERAHTCICENRLTDVFEMYKFRDLTIEGRALPDSNENPE